MGRCRTCCFAVQGFGSSASSLLELDLTQYKPHFAAFRVFKLAKAYQASYPIAMKSSVLGVCTSGYFDCGKQALSRRVREH